jgi:hypothetical protein
MRRNTRSLSTGAHSRDRVAIAPYGPDLNAGQELFAGGAELVVRDVPIPVAAIYSLTRIFLYDNIRR